MVRARCSAPSWPATRSPARPSSAWSRSSTPDPCSARSPSCIRDDDTTAELLERLADWGSKLLVDVIDHIEDGDIAASAAGGQHLLRAEAHHRGGPDRLAPTGVRDRPAHPRLHPGPGAWTLLASERVKIGPATIADERTLVPGQLVDRQAEVRVGTTTTDLVLGDVQAIGKKRMPAADWARGTTFDRPTRRSHD